MNTEETVRQRVSDALLSYREGHQLTQEEIAEILANYNISLSSYRRAERGSKNISISKLITIMDVLNIEMRKIPFTDTDVILARTSNREHGDYIQDQIEKYFYSDNLATALDISYRRLLFIFILYLPLIPGATLQDMLSRIAGDIIGNETYVIDQIARAIDSVPSSPAKVYADRIYSRINHLVSDDVVYYYATKEMYDREDISIYKKGDFTAEYNQYCDAIRDRFSIEEWVKSVNMKESSVQA